MEGETISVIIPAYNVAPWLPRCLDSILAQTYPKLEIIVVDDGSADNARQVMEDYAARDGRIRPIFKENGGVTSARLAGVAAATGEWVGFADGDDAIDPDMYRHLLENAHTYDADISHCGHRVEFPDGRVAYVHNTGGLRQQDNLTGLRDLLDGGQVESSLCTKLYRRETVGDIRFPVGTKIDDEFFTYRVLGNAKRLVRSTRKLYAYRQQPDSVMHGGFSLRRLEGVQAQEQRLAYLKTHMPSLEYEGRANLFLYCQYAMQMSIQYLSGEELRQAKESLRKTVSGLTPLLPSRKLSPAGNVWLVLGQLSFEGSCRLMNCLERRNGKGSE